MMGRVGNILVVTLISLLFAVSCTKKRSDQFAQGYGNYIQTYGELDGKTFTLTTGAAISETATTASEKIIVEGEVPEGIRILPLVTYTTDADLLGEIPFRGRPNTRYQIRYKLNKRYLTVEKVAREKDIPSDEMTYADDLGNGFFAVPLVGYSVSYYHLEKRRNSDNEDTNEWIEIPDLEPTRASHVKFSRLDRQVFSALTKIDVFPAQYFLGNTEKEEAKKKAGQAYWDGEWYFSETVVSTTEDSSAYVGDTSGTQDASFNPAPKIRFQKDKDQLRGVNINIDERLKEIKKDDRLNYAPVITIPVEWKSYRIGLDGTGDSLREEDRTEISWDKRDYMAVKFEDTRTVIKSLETYLINLSGGKKMIDLKFAENYFSYALLDIDSGQIVRYSFLKALKKDNDPLEYKPRSYRSVTRKDYGFFTSSWNMIYNYELYTQEDAERHTYLNRFNPKKEVVFYITDNSPDDELYNRVTQKAVEFWDKSFRLAGAPTRVRFDNSKRVNLADLRYSAVNYIDGVSSGSGLLGFGPSLSDPFTGEIIMATSNMHVANFRSSIVSQLRLYVRQELGYFEAAIDNEPGRVLGGVGGLANMDANATMANPLNYKFILDKNGEPKDFEVYVQDFVTRDGYRKVSYNNFSPNSPFSRLVNYVDKKGLPKNAHELSQRYIKLAAEKPAALRYASHVDREKFTTIMSETIELRCPELKTYAETIATAGVPLTTESELAAMDRCVNIFLEEKLLATLVHEMGHNFGLAHNFRASTDEKNFWNAEELQEHFGISVDRAHGIPRSSSTMDYIPLEHDRLITPGKYDIAALNFGYVDEEVDAKGNVVKGRPAPLVKIEGQPFYCDDWDFILGQDALCMQHDYGVTPLEIVNNDIRLIEQNMAVFRYRFDRRVAPRAMYSNIDRMMRIRTMYDHWRFKLKDFVGNKAGYLQGLYNPWNGQSGELYKRNVLDKMAASPAFKKDYELFFPVRDRVYNFLKGIAFMPDAVCTYTDRDGEQQWVPLTTIREDVKANKGRNNNVASCNDPIVSEVIASVYNGKFERQVGQPVSDTHFSLDVEDIRYTDADVVGIFTERIMAGILIAERVVHPLVLGLATLGHQDANLFPSILDEPDLRDDYTNEILTRLVVGADLKPYTDDPKNAAQGYAETYSNESGIIGVLYNMLLATANVPGSQAEYSTRMTPMLTKVYRTEAEANQDGAVKVLRINGQLVGARRENTFVQYLMNEYESAEFRAQNIEAIMAERANIVTAGRNILAAIPAASPLGGGGIQSVAQFRTFGAALASTIQQYGERSIVGQLINYMFGIELQIYASVLDPMDKDLAKMKTDITKLEAQLASGLEADGTTALTEARKTEITNQVTQLKQQVAQVEPLLAGTTAFGSFYDLVNQQMAGGNLPPLQALTKQDVSSRFANLTKKGLAHEIDAKRTLLLNAIVSGAQ